MGNVFRSWLRDAKDGETYMLAQVSSFEKYRSIIGRGEEARLVAQARDSKDIEIDVLITAGGPFLLAKRSRQQSHCVLHKRSS